MKNRRWGVRGWGRVRETARLHAICAGVNFQMYINNRDK